MKKIIVSFLSVGLLFTVGCESESDKRQKRIEQLTHEINQTEKDIQLIDDYLEACSKVAECK